MQANNSFWISVIVHLSLLILSTPWQRPNDKVHENYINVKLATTQRLHLVNNPGPVSLVNQDIINDVNIFSNSFLSTQQPISGHGAPASLNSVLYENILQNHNPNLANNSGVLRHPNIDNKSNVFSNKITPVATAPDAEALSTTISSTTISTALDNTTIQQRKGKVALEQSKSYLVALSQWFYGILPETLETVVFDGELRGSVKITIGRDGQIRSFKIAQSTGSEDLDNLLMQTLRDNPHTLQIPEYFHNQKNHLTFLLPVLFTT